jgi:hypothetical protein
LLLDSRKQHKGKAWSDGQQIRCDRKNTGACNGKSPRVQIEQNQKMKKNPHAVALGRKGGKAKSARKTAANKLNALKRWKNKTTNEKEK